MSCKLYDLLEVGESNGINNLTAKINKIPQVSKKKLETMGSNIRRHDIRKGQEYQLLLLNIGYSIPFKRRLVVTVNCFRN